MYRKTVEELQKDQREKLVIDIRSEQDYIKETYPGAKHIFWEEFMEHIGEIPKELPVYLFCYTGQRSDEIAEDLSAGCDVKSDRFRGKHKKDGTEKCQNS